MIPIPSTPNKFKIFVQTESAQITKDPSSFTSKKQRKKRTAVSKIRLYNSVLTHLMFKKSWIDQYRPTTFDEVKGQSLIVQYFTRLLNNDLDENNIILVGRSGVGKTTCAHLLIDHYVQKMQEDKASVCLQLNGSVDNGIQTVRDCIVPFCEAYGSYSRKFVLIDEADAMTLEAQGSLRVEIERFSRVLFILVCNYQDSIIDPLQSRSLVLRFENLTNLQIKERINEIATQENIEVDPSGIDTIVKICKGDLRAAINMLELISKQQCVIDEGLVCKVMRRPTTLQSQHIYQVLNSKNTSLNDKMCQLRMLVEDNGVSLPDLIEYVMDQTIMNVKDEKMVVKLVIDLGDMYRNASSKMDLSLTMLRFASVFCNME